MEPINNPSPSAFKRTVIDAADSSAKRQRVAQVAADYLPPAPFIGSIVDEVLWHEFASEYKDYIKNCQDSKLPNFFEWLDGIRKSRFRNYTETAFFI